MADVVTFAANAFIAVIAVAIGSYFVTGLVLRAIRDFKSNRNQNGGTGNGKEDI